MGTLGGDADGHQDNLLMTLGQSTYSNSVFLHVIVPVVPFLSMSYQQRMSRKNNRHSSIGFIRLKTQGRLDDLISFSCMVSTLRTPSPIFSFVICFSIFNFIIILLYGNFTAATTPTNASI